MTRQEMKAYIKALRVEMREISEKIIFGDSRTIEGRKAIHTLQDEYNKLAKIRMELDI